MENKTALQQFIEWGDKMMLEHPLKVLSFAEAIDKAAELLEVEKEQITDAYIMGSYDVAAKEFRPEQYYNETYATHKQTLPGQEGHS
jgi:predicted hotdog family 3-hydroxylacyl-ACP dehydratase